MKNDKKSPIVNIFAKKEISLIEKSVKIVCKERDEFREKFNLKLSDFLKNPNDKN